MAEAYVGSAVLEVDGVETEITDLNVTKTTGRKLVKTMNSTGKAKGFARGIQLWELNVTAAVPLEGNIDWENIEDGKVTVYPLGQNDKRTTYRGCFTESVGEKYTVDNEEVQDVKLFALDCIEE
ncbi:phage tail protein [Actinobacillus sp. GY-402]|nr:phage tail protein [Actinobacillus sp. GY-402]